MGLVARVVRRFPAGGRARRGARLPRPGGNDRLKSRQRIHAKQALAIRAGQAKVAKSSRNRPPQPTSERVTAKGHTICNSPRRPFIQLRPCPGGRLFILLPFAMTLHKEPGCED